MSRLDYKYDTSVRLEKKQENGMETGACAYDFLFPVYSRSATMQEWVQTQVSAVIDFFLRLSLPLNIPGDCNVVSRTCDSSGDKHKGTKDP